MKILFVCQYFYPEVFRGNDIAFHWAEEGHEVHVVCGVPNYPKGKFFEGYGWFKKRHEVVDGVKVTRLPIVPRGNGKVTLMLNYFSYLVVAWVWMLFHTISHRCLLTTKEGFTMEGLNAGFTLQVAHLRPAISPQMQVLELQRQFVGMQWERPEEE